MTELTTQARDKKRGFLRTALLQLLLIAASLVAAELILRTVDLRYLRAYRTGSDRVYNYDAELGWIPVANSAMVFTGSRPINVRHNSLGLRDIEHDATPKRTIAFIGDSFVWGYDAEAEERFTELLRARLPAHRIVNAGVTAYGNDQEYLLLDRLWPRIKPDVVVLMFCTDNDRKDNSANTRQDGPYKPYFVAAPDGKGRFAGQPVPWSRHLYFTEYWFARHSWVVRAAVSAYVLLRHPVVAVPDPTEHLIGMMRELVESRGAKFLVGMQYREPRLETYLRERNIPYVSFDGAEHYARDGDHWTPAGHAVVADRLMKLLSDHGIVAPKAGP